MLQSTKTGRTNTRALWPCLILFCFTPAAAATDGTVLGPYQGAEVCLSEELDLYCDGPTTRTDAAGAFSIDGDGEWLVAYVDDTTEQVRGDGTIPTERPMVFLAAAADAAVMSARSTAVVAEMAAGRGYAEALARVAARHDIPAADLLADPDTIADPDLRARIDQAELDLRERIRLVMQTASWRKDAADWLPLELIPERRGPSPADCGQSWTDAATGEQHRVYRLTDDSATGVHLVTRTVTGTTARGRRLRRFSRQRIVSARAVTCSEVHSTIAGRALGDGRFASAEVCLDATGDGRCADEASGYRTQADAQGRFRLTDLPDDLLAEHGLIAEAVTGERLRGSGDMVLVNDGEALLTPTLSVIAQYAERYDIRFGALYRDVLDTLELDPELNLGVIDYAEPSLATEPSAQALADFDAILINDPDYAAFMDGTTFPEEWIDWLKQAYAAQTGNAWPDPIDLEQLETSVGAEARYDGYFDVATLGLVQANSAPSGPTRTDSSNRVDYVMDNLSDTIRALARDGTIASARAGGLAETLVERGWPSGLNVATYRLQTLLYPWNGAVQYAHTNQLMRAFGRANLELEALGEMLNDYATAAAQAGAGAAEFDIAFAKAGELADGLWEDRDQGRLQLQVAVFAQTARLLLTRERLNHPELLAPGSDPETLRAELLEEYTRWRDRLLLGAEGRPALFEDHLQLRSEQIVSSYGWDESAWPLVSCVGEVEDTVSKWKIQFRDAAWTCDGIGGASAYAASVENVRQRLMSEARLRAAKVMSPVFLWSRLLPPDLVATAPGLSDTERLGAAGYVVPDALKSFWVGPYSVPCLRYTSFEVGTTPGPRCEYDDGPGSTASTPLRHLALQDWFTDGILRVQLQTAPLGSDPIETVRWGDWDTALHPTARWIEAMPPLPEQSLVGVTFGLRTCGTLDSARFNFLARRPTAPKYPRLFYAYHTTDFDDWNLCDRWAVAAEISGSLDYLVSGMKWAPAGYAKSNLDTTFVEFAFFPDGEHRVE